MQKLFLFIVLCFMSSISTAIAVSSKSAAVPDYPNLLAAQAKAQSLLAKCLIPNLDPDMQAYCSTEYGLYIARLKLLNAPLPLQPNFDGYVSPFVWSPYDICRFETGRLINLVC